LNHAMPLALPGVTSGAADSAAAEHQAVPPAEECRVAVLA
jgi:hypothetical protein